MTNSENVALQSNTKQDLLLKWTAMSSATHRPIQASLELTNRCNERCSHCYIDDFSDDPHRKLNEEQWFYVLEQMREAGILFLILMGGEPLLSPHFWTVLKRASEMGFHVSIITNAIKVKDQGIALELKAAGLTAATVSFYSVHPAEHDKMTGVPGSCVRTMKAIEMMQAAGIEVAINCLLTKTNIGSVFDLYDYATKLNIQVKADYNITPKLSGNMDPTKQRASIEQLDYYFKQMVARFKDATPSPTGEDMSSYMCNAAKGKCAVTTYGELLACIEVRTPLGHLLEVDFETAWQSEEAKKWRFLRVRDMENLKSLEHQNFCDHCPGLSEHEHGNHLQLTEFAENVGSLRQDIWKSCQSNCAQESN